jgi:hypothetical protein
MFSSFRTAFGFCYLLLKPIIFTEKLYFLRLIVFVAVSALCTRAIDTSFGWSVTQNCLILIHKYSLAVLYFVVRVISLFAPE